MPGAASAMPALPAGFRFHPTDEELIVHYLMNQAAAVACPVPIIAEVNIYQCNPWDLPAKAVFGEKEWYFFSPRDRKYPNGGRPNRAAGSGYWKATGTDKAIVSTPASRSIGVKKALVFYRGKPPKGVKTDWIMHEYRLTPATTNATTKRRRPGPSPSMRLDDWVLCRIYKKSNDFFQLQLSSQHEQEGSTMLEEASLTNAAMNNSSNASSSSPESELAPPDPAMAMAIPKSCSLTDLLATIDYSTLSHLLLDGSPDTPAPAPPSPLIYATPPCQTLSYGSSHISDACLDYGVNYSGLKRLPVATDTDSEYSTDRSFEDGSGFAKKMQLPSDSKVDSYCVQQFADESGFQYSSLLASHLLLNQQQLLSNHLQMQ